MKKIAGTLLLAGATQFIVFMIISEALYSGYSTADNYISDLGVGPSAIVFNSSIVLLGLMIIGAAYYILKAYKSKLVTILVLLSGIGAMGVGIFSEDFGVIHAIVSVMVFLFGGLAAISIIKLEKSLIGYISAVMGIIGIISLVLFMTDNSLGLGVGGMERMIAYPLLLWVIGFGGYLIGSQDKQSSEK